ncbi:DUF2185 domain-containing protein [Roseateles sp. DAIF2]|uniref:DUF2185 domain-containing protein n=1 Tax=Roseateles sp. DAIF2 TaxID=2714952 RepID=UPI0018A28642|nr:DUF2185 domain-containing protein [Roseateles sp. DAIF2]QPF76464.1 DUF2185 domain-containing protein [Roseateles sp. DAIF2]
MQPKLFQIIGGEIRQLISGMGGCFASNRITVDGAPVGYMYREPPDNETDSGWRFFAGDESEEYADTPDNFAIYDVNTICNYDPAVIPYLSAPAGMAYGRILGTADFAQESSDDEDDV